MEGCEGLVSMCLRCCFVSLSRIDHDRADNSDPDEVGRRKYRGLEFLEMTVGDLFE